MNGTISLWHVRERNLMSKMTPEQEARYALGFNVGRSGLSAAAQQEYDRLLREEYGGPQGIPDAVFPADRDMAANSGLLARVPPN
jgi:hypothetical protein